MIWRVCLNCGRRTGKPHLTFVSVGCCSRARVCLDRRSETQIFVDPGASVVTHLWITCCSAPQLSIKEVRHIAPSLARLRQRIVIPETMRQSLKHYQLRLVSCPHERTAQRTRRTQQQVALTRDEQRRRHVVQVSV